MSFPQREITSVKPSPMYPATTPKPSREYPASIVRSIKVSSRLDLRQFFGIALQHYESIQVATVSGEDHWLKALDSPISLQLTIILHHFLPQLHGQLSLPTKGRFRPIKSNLSGIALPHCDFEVCGYGL